MKRPKITKEIIIQAAVKFVEKNKLESDCVTELCQCYSVFDNGFELAKSLESRFGWDISASDVEMLDCFDDMVQDLHRAECFKWAKDNNIYPPLPIGTMTNFGKITGIYTHDAAKYLIKEHDEIGTSRRIIKFEDVRPV